MILQRVQRVCKISLVYQFINIIRKCGEHEIELRKTDGNECVILKVLAQ